MCVCVFSLSLSTMTVWGREGEKAAMKHILDVFQTGAVSVVSDSYDIW